MVQLRVLHCEISQAVDPAEALMLVSGRWKRVGVPTVTEQNRTLRAAVGTA